MANGNNQILADKNNGDCPYSSQRKGRHTPIPDDKHSFMNNIEFHEIYYNLPKKNVNLLL